MPEVTAAKIRLTARVVSFRYPHFLVGRQPSYDMPPPSTIFGHIASAVGDPALARDAARFAYTFSFVARASDLEYQHVITRYRPEKLSRQEQRSYRSWEKRHPLSVGGSIQPTARDFLFGVELILYVEPASLGAAFRSPAFPVVLGRSQDLACVTSVEDVVLGPASGAYFNATLLPFSWRGRTRFGTTVLMPRYITPAPMREASFTQYLVLHADRTLYAGNAAVSEDHPRRLLRHAEHEEWLVDPGSPIHEGVHRGLVFHGFAE